MPDDTYFSMKSEEQIAICKLCCCECIDTDEEVCCHTTKMGDCDCHTKEEEG